MSEACGIIHPPEFANVRDPHGCILPMGHQGPHKFLSSKGVAYRWEEVICPDCDCDLEAGDCCTEYWPARTDGGDGGEGA